MYILISFVLVQLEIKNHVFFSPINWDDLYHKRITPPYNPNVVSGLVLLSGTHFIRRFYHPVWMQLKLKPQGQVSPIGLVGFGPIGTAYVVCPRK